MKKETITRRRKEIIKNALEVFTEKGWEKASLEDIAIHSGLSKPALYLYFKNKEDLLYAIVDSTLTSLEETASHISGSTKEKLEKFVYTMISFYEKNSTLFNLFEHVDKKIMKKYHKKLKKRLFYCISSLAKFMTECIKDKVLKPASPMFYAISLIGLINSNFMMAKLNLPQTNSDDSNKLTKQILDLFLNGASPHL